MGGPHPSSLPPQSQWFPLTLPVLNHPGSTMPLSGAPSPLNPIAGGDGDPPKKKTQPPFIPLPNPKPYRGGYQPPPIPQPNSEHPRPEDTIAGHTPPTIHHREEKTPKTPKPPQNPLKTPKIPQNPPPIPLPPQSRCPSPPRGWLHTGGGPRASPPKKPPGGPHYPPPQPLLTAPLPVPRGCGLRSARAGAGQGAGLREGTRRGKARKGAWLRGRWAWFGDGGRG